MKPRYVLFRRGEMFYSEDTTTGQQASLRTRHEAEAVAILNAKNESFRQPGLNLQIARAYLAASDPASVQRTWQNVMDQLEANSQGPCKVRYISALKSKAYDSLRPKKLLETTAEDFLPIVSGASVSVVHFLKRVHNLAVSYGWLPLPVLAPRLWPKLTFKPKRGITAKEHAAVLSSEHNPERNLFYQLLWEIGASQSDAAALTADNIDWPTRTLSYPNQFHRHSRAWRLCNILQLGGRYRLQCKYIAIHPKYRKVEPARRHA